MSINNYDAGDQVRLTATFKDRAGTNTDPTTVTFKYLKPGGSVVSDTGSVVNDDVGIYYYDLTIDNTPGRWRYRFEGIGALVAAEDGEFYVTPSDLA